MSPYARKRPLPDSVPRVMNADVVTEDGQEQPGEEPGPAVEEVVDDRPVGRGGDDRHREREHEAEERGALHEGPAAFAAGPPRRNRAADLLFEGLEETGREDEDHRPEHVERVVLVVRQPFRGQDLEAVRAEADDDQARADCPGALGHGELLGGARQPLYTLYHERERLLGAGTGATCGTGSGRVRR